MRPAACVKVRPEARPAQVPDEGVAGCGSVNRLHGEPGMPHDAGRIEIGRAPGAHRKHRGRAGKAGLQGPLQRFRRALARQAHAPLAKPTYLSKNHSAFLSISTVSVGPSNTKFIFNVPRYASVA